MSVFLTVLFITLQYATNRAALRCKLRRTAAQRSVVWTAALQLQRGLRLHFWPCSAAQGVLLTLRRPLLQLQMQKLP